MKIYTLKKNQVVELYGNDLNGKAPNFVTANIFFNRLILQDLHNKGINAWVAGGSVLSYIQHGKINDDSDIDIFFKSRKDFDLAKSYFSSMNGKLLSRHTSHPNSLKVEYNNKFFDLVELFYEDPLECIYNFDFTICAIASNGTDLFIHNDFFKHLAKKTLKFINYRGPSAAWMRIGKYLGKGYNIDMDELQVLINEMRNNKIKLVSFY